MWHHGVLLCPSTRQSSQPSSSSRTRQLGGWETSNIQSRGLCCSSYKVSHISVSPELILTIIHCLDLLRPMVGRGLTMELETMSLMSSPMRWDYDSSETYQTWWPSWCTTCRCPMTPLCRSSSGSPTTASPDCVIYWKWYNWAKQITNPPVIVPLELFSQTSSKHCYVSRWEREFDLTLKLEILQQL